MRKTISIIILSLLSSFANGQENPNNQITKQINTIFEFMLLSEILDYKNEYDSAIFIAVTESFVDLKSGITYELIPCYPEDQTTVDKRFLDFRKKHPNDSYSFSHEEILIYTINLNWGKIDLPQEYKVFHNRDTSQIQKIYTTNFKVKFSYNNDKNLDKIEFKYNNKVKKSFPKDILKSYHFIYDKGKLIRFNKQNINGKSELIVINYY